MAIGLAVAAAGTTLWAVTVAFLVPAARAGEEAAMAVPDEAQEIPSDRWLSLWVHDLRWAAIVVIVCGLALVARGRGLRKQSIPVVCGAALFAVDGMFTWLDATGSWAAAAAFGVVSVIAAPAVVVSRTGATAEGPRQDLFGYGIAAAWCAPLLLANAHDGVSRFVPAGLAVAVGAAQVLLVLVAVASTAFTLPRIPRGTVPMAAGFAVVLGVTGVLAATDDDVVWALLLGGALIVFLLLLDLQPWSARSYVVFGAITICYPAVVLVSFFVALGPTTGVLALSGDSYPADGVAALPGGILAGTVAGVLTVWTRARRRPLPQGRESHAI